MITVRDKDSGTVLGDISDVEFRFLAERLENESSGDTDYYINSDLLDVLATRGIPQHLLDLLRQSLGDRGEMEIECVGEIEKPDTDPMRDRILRMEDEDLLDMAREADQYRPEIMAIATEEIARRGLSVDAEEPVRISEIETDRPIEDAGVLEFSGMEPLSFQAAGITIVCPHCKSSQFHAHNALVNTRGLTFLRLDWLNRGATVLVCADCGQIQWFSEKPERQ